MDQRLRHPEYYPPTDEAIDDFVRDVSVQMAAQRGDEEYLNHEVMWGLSAFIKLVARIKAKQLNQASNGSDFDNLDNRDYPTK